MRITAAIAVTVTDTGIDLAIQPLDGNFEPTLDTQPLDVRMPETGGDTVDRWLAHYDIGVIDMVCHDLVETISRIRDTDGLETLAAALDGGEHRDIQQSARYLKDAMRGDAVIFGDLTVSGDKEPGLSLVGIAHELGTDAAGIHHAPLRAVAIADCQASLLELQDGYNLLRKIGF